MKHAIHPLAPMLLAALLLAACGSDDSGAQTAATSTPSSTTPAATTATTTSPGQPQPTSTAAPDAPTAQATPAPIDFAAFFAANCAVCHGSNRGGVGRTPPLTPDALTDSVDHYLAATDDRTHSAIWTRTGLTDDDRRALIEYLSTVAP